MEKAAEERALLIISGSSEEFDWWENHSGVHRLPAGSIKLRSRLTQREAILPEDHFYEDPQLEALRSTAVASPRASSCWALGCRCAQEYRANPNVWYRAVTGPLHGHAEGQDVTRCGPSEALAGAASRRADDEVCRP
jgi:hypothetical protein